MILHERRPTNHEQRRTSMLRRSLVSLALLLPVLFVSPLARAAGMTVTKTTTAGAYKLTLQIGPAETMMNMGGPHAMCAMKGGMEMRPVAKMPACNHHVELHVYNAKTGKVVTGLHVTIDVTGGKHVSM